MWDFLVGYVIGSLVYLVCSQLYKKWKAKEDGITKIVIDPWVDTVADPRAKVA